MAHCWQFCMGRLYMLVVSVAKSNRYDYSTFLWMIARLLRFSYFVSRRFYQKSKLAILNLKQNTLLLRSLEITSRLCAVLLKCQLELLLLTNCLLWMYYYDFVCFDCMQNSVWLHRLVLWLIELFLQEVRFTAVLNYYRFIPTIYDNCVL